MADQPARLEAATVRAEVGSNIVYRFANDAASAADIPTLSGEIPNLSKIILTIQQEGADKISFSTRIYQTTAAGIAATSDQEIFLVQTDDPDEIYAVWQNVAGTAVDTGKRSLSAAAVIAATQAASDAATAAQESADDATARVARFLAPSSVEPVQRDNGQPLEVGDQWPNSSNGLVYNWNGTAWVPLNESVQEFESRILGDSGSGLVGHEIGADYPEGTAGMVLNLRPNPASSSVGYIETYVGQIGYPDVPANLASEQAPGSASIPPSMNWRAAIVSGVVGDKKITCTINSAVSGAGNSSWPCVLENEDGTYDVNLVVGEAVAGTFPLALPIKKTPVAITSRWDQAQGQHMTVTGTRAYAEHAYSQLTNICTATQMVGPWLGALQPPVYQGLWSLNAASVAYGRVVINGVATELLAETSERNSVNNGRLSRLSRDPGEITIGVHEQGQGGVATWTTDGRKGYVEIFACTRAGPQTLSQRGSATLKIIGVLNGSEYVIKEENLTDELVRVVCPYSGFDTLMARFESTSGYPFTLSLNKSVCWVSEESCGRIIDKDAKIVTFGDSWFGYYEGEFSKHLQRQMRKDGGKGVVVNRGYGGMTTRFALDWLDTYVINEPGVKQCIFHFFTNDLNNLGGATYLDPNGVAKPLNVNSRYELVANLRKLASRCEQAGIQPIIIMPAGKASAVGGVEQQKAATLMRMPVYTDKAPSISQAELSDPSSHINNYGKTTGKAVVVGSDVMYAQGSSREAKWANTQNNRLSLLESLSIPVKPFNVSSVVIGVDSNSDGLSDGIFTVPYGVNTGTTNVFTIEDGIQKQTATYTSAASTGNTRMEFPAPAIANNKYVFIIEMAGGTPSMQFDAVMRSSAGAIQAIPQLYDGDTGEVLQFASQKTLSASGGRLLFFTITAQSSGIVGAFLAPNGSRTALPSTQAIGVRRISVINATAFGLATGVDIASYSDYSLAALMNSALNVVPPSFIYLTDSVTKEIRSLSISDGVVVVK